MPPQAPQPQPQQPLQQQPQQPQQQHPHPPQQHQPYHGDSRTPLRALSRHTTTHMQFVRQTWDNFVAGSQNILAGADCESQHWQDRSRELQTDRTKLQNETARLNNALKLSEKLCVTRNTDNEESKATLIREQLAHRVAIQQFNLALAAKDKELVRQRAEDRAVIAQLHQDNQILRLQNPPVQPRKPSATVTTQVNSDEFVDFVSPTAATMAPLGFTLLPDAEVAELQLARSSIAQTWAVIGTGRQEMNQARDELNQSRDTERQALYALLVANMAAQLVTAECATTHRELIEHLSSSKYADASKFPKKYTWRRARRRATRAVGRGVQYREQQESGASDTTDLED